MLKIASIAALLAISVSAAPLPQASSSAAAAVPSSQAQSNAASSAPPAAASSTAPQASSSSPASQPSSSSAPQASSSSPAALTQTASSTTGTPASSSAPAASSTAASSDSDVSKICSLSPSDPASWIPSGADSFLDAWFAANGTENWLQNMDQAFSPAGPDFQSTLNCKSLDGSSCPPPSFACDKFEHPELRFIEVAASNAHDFFSAARQSLVVETIRNILNVQQIVLDFNPTSAKGNSDSSISEIASGAQLAGTILKDAAGATEVGTALSIIGGLFGLIPDEDDKRVDATVLVNAVNKQLEAIFTGINAAIETFNSQLFGGSEDKNLTQLVSTLEGAGFAVADPNAQNSITKIFSSGVFLKSQDQSPLAAGIENALKQIKKGLVGALLKALNYYVFIDTTLTSDKCTAVGSRFLNGQCHILSQRVKPGASGQTDTEPIDADIILKFDNPADDYNIDPVAFYQNIDDCAGGSLDTSAISVTDGFPKCFFSLPVIKVDGPHVCSLLPKGASVDDGPAPGTPANLDITFGGCGRAVCLNGGFFGKGCD